MRNGKNLLIIFSIVAINFRLAASSDARKRLDKSCENGICFREQDKGPCIPSDDEPRLFRWDPIKKSHVRELELEERKTYKMITLASKPPLFAKVKPITS